MCRRVTPRVSARIVSGEHAGVGPEGLYLKACLTACFEVDLSACELER